MKTSPLRTIKSSSDGYAISLSVINQIIDRIEDLVDQAEKQRLIAGSNIQISYTSEGAVINVQQ